MSLDDVYVLDDRDRDEFSDDDEDLFLLFRYGRGSSLYELVDRRGGDSFRLGSLVDTNGSLFADGDCSLPGDTE